MDWDGIGSFALFAAVGLMGAAFLLGPIGRSIARRIAGREPGALDEESAARIQELEHRVAEVEQANGRITELEERLDFAERLLGQSGAADHLPAGDKD
jgi:hypothetical protein